MNATRSEPQTQKIRLNSVDEAFKVDSWRRLTEEVESSFREFRFENGFCLWVLAHLDYAVVWGTATWSGTDGLKWNLDPEYETGLPVISLQQLRLFGQSGEMFVWRESFEKDIPVFRFRLVWDVDSGAAEHISSHPCIDETWALWGTRLEDNSSRSPNGEWSLISEERGMKLRLPIPPEEVKEAQSGLENIDPRVLVKVRKYFDFDNNTGLAYTYLTRLVDLVWPLKQEQERAYTPLKST